MVAGEGMTMDAEQLIRAYYDAFNAEDEAAFMALLTEDVVHDINQGEREIGKAAFAAFWERMSRCYKETLTDIMVLTEPSGTRAAAEFMVHGTYMAADEGLPPAKGQHYKLPAGAFFSIRGGKVARVSNYYNLPDWLAQVS
jgi:steroid delta-isomerase-like uncharacterized protein